MALTQKKIYFKRAEKAREFPNALSPSHIRELGCVKAVECLPQLLVWGVLFSHQEQLWWLWRTLGLAWIRLCISPMQLLISWASGAVPLNDRWCLRSFLVLFLFKSSGVNVTFLWFDCHEMWINAYPLVFCCFLFSIGNDLQLSESGSDSDD